MKCVRILGLLVFLLPASTALAQQSGRIDGTVTATSGSPIQGATVVVVGTPGTAVTGADGRYTIFGVSAGVHSIRATMIGYAPEDRQLRVDAGAAARADFSLTPQAITMEGVVAVGYGTQRRRDITGAISSVDLDQASTVPVTSIDQALRGQVAGVQVTQANGAPGSAVSVRIRGATSITAGSGPLYVIDGVPAFTDNTRNAGSPSNPLAGLPASDIASIEVLKDASATAIYGSRGANGVVLITTKRGRRGDNQVEFTASYGVQEITRRLDLLNAAQYAQLANDGRAAAGLSPVFSAADIATMGAGTDWQEEIFRPAPVQSYGVSVSGGDEATRYMISGNMFDQTGTLLGSDFRRYSARLNLDRDVSSHFRVGSSVAGNRTSSNFVRTDANENAGMVMDALQFSPTEPVYNADGTYVQESPTALANPNPVATALELLDDRTNTQVIGNLYAEYDLTDALRLRSTVGGTINSVGTTRYAPRTIKEGASLGGDATAGSSNSWNLVNDNLLSYHRTVADGHDLDFTGGFSMQSARSEGLTARAQQFTTDVTGANDLSAGATILPAQTSVSEWTLASWLGRVNYNLFDRYLLTVTGRYDGSSKFGTNNKWGFFPSAALAWRVSDEAFLSDVDWLTDAKLRLSYGATGNQEIGTYASLAALETNRYFFSGKEVIGYAPTLRANNPDLRWESTKQLNAGIDFGLWDNRLTGTVDAYRSRTSDLLLEVPLPRTTGFATQLRNIGAVKNTGIELSINTVNVDRPGFTWTTGANIATNRNEVVDLGATDRVYLGGTGDVRYGMLQVGQPLGIFEGYRTNGIWQTNEDWAGSGDLKAEPGERKFVDVSGDGTIDADDRTILGNAQPDFTGGLNSSVGLGRFTFDLSFNGVYGNDIMNSTAIFMTSSTGQTNEFVSSLDRWTPTNPSNTVPRAYSQRSRTNLDIFIEDGSFLRLQALTLGYDLPERFLRGAGRGQLYVSGQNLWTWTNYSGFDPEVSRFASDPARAGIDVGSYPQSRTLNLGVNLTF